MQQLWEIRHRYVDRVRYSPTSGRSILHELSDVELTELVEYLRARLAEGELIERDRWTLWTAVAP
ncbi:hypothetical protein CH260_15835 [Rhodococcus sp. 05-2256-B2]|uniref:hypothetical protein n=1 Tax=unclassified Rhodococcus (in: high G+C Gram-positive bacteria) TaxID=192944 RepID=UPI000BDAC799|nr:MULTISPECIES: hypothetical protein [unclassified Rhodococcus (in: high G+C Gram-positive bacteria)]OZD93144.1 hypothetical protein CH258_02355 [Rhodococcus sp. 05-2256-B4]OZD94488.1 hypothetical protein CH260_15835 [Rhodococcus sp. 05-2256-B2]OZD99922.1 hypothetical protein CH257_00010 [Rhodococcus sp. 05-2256-B3]OZE08605.1 hypothetical protein CH285_00885 [Rhodococcus sp. 05-2256-B1]